MLEEGSLDGLNVGIFVHFYRPFEKFVRKCAMKKLLN